MDRTLDVARREVEEGRFLQGAVARVRRALAHSGLLHVVQQPADVATDELGLQRPRGVRVADRQREVRHVAEHHALVVVGLREIDADAVDGDPEAAQQ